MITNINSIEVEIIKKKDNIYGSISGNILGIIEYGLKKDKDEFGDIPYQFIEVAKLSENFYEIWFTSEKVSYLKIGKCSIAISKSYCFQSITSIYEDDYKEISQKVYEQIFESLNKESYNITRFWNYIPEITKVECLKQRYKEFCIGREKAFCDFYNDNFKVYPAATGIGIKGENLCISLISINKNKNLINIENPRQIPAYQYSNKYGSSAPIFSRATYIQDSNLETIFVSGTASIVGEETVYLDNIVMQTETTIENIEILLSSQNLQKYNIKDISFIENLKYIKVYIKNWEEYSIIKNICEKHFEKEKIMYIQSDICREELLVEIEGVWMKKTK